MSARHMLLTPYKLRLPGAPSFADLAADGWTLDYNETGRVLTQAELRDRLHVAEVVILGAERFGAAEFEAAPALRLLVRLGVGHEKVDLDAAARHDVTIAICAGGNHEPVADFAFALIAALGCRLLPYHRNVSGGGWTGGLHGDLAGARVGILGLGRIGRALARRCTGFGMQVLGHDPQPDTAWAADMGVELMGLEALLRRADYVSLHVPATPENRHLIDASSIGLMRPGAFLINTGRGELVDEEALVAALEAGRIAGAGLDVFAREPPANPRLLALPNVILTPHTAGGSAGAFAAMARIATGHVLRHACGLLPEAPHLILAGRKVAPSVG